MKTRITIQVNNGKEIGSFSIEYPTMEDAQIALTNSMTPLRRKGVFCAEQLCFELLLDGISIEKSK